MKFCNLYGGVARRPQWYMTASEDNGSNDVCEYKEEEDDDG